MSRKKPRINYIKEKPEIEDLPGEDKRIQKLEKKREQAKEKVRLKEVRKVLLGNVIQGEDNRLKPVVGFNMNWWGTADGSFGTRLFGIFRKRVTYVAKGLNNSQVIYQTAKAMGEYGRGVDLETVYEGCTCLLKHFFFRPVVLVFEHKEDNEYVLSAYCGKDIFTISSIQRAISLFEANKPSGIEKG